MGALKFKGKPVNIRITNALDFKLRSEGLFKTHLLITNGASIVKFCRAWAIVLGEKFEQPAPDFSKCKTVAARAAELDRITAETQKAAESFIEGFSDLDGVNKYALGIIQRDTPAEKESPEEKKKRLKR